MEAVVAVLPARTPVSENTHQANPEATSLRGGPARSHGLPHRKLQCERGPVCHASMSRAGAAHTLGLPIGGQ